MTVVDYARQQDAIIELISKCGLNGFEFDILEEENITTVKLYDSTIQIQVTPGEWDHKYIGTLTGTCKEEALSRAILLATHERNKI